MLQRYVLVTDESPQKIFSIHLLLLYCFWFQDVIKEQSKELHTMLALNHCKLQSYPSETHSAFLLNFGAKFPLFCAPFLYAARVKNGL